MTRDGRAASTVLAAATFPRSRQFVARLLQRKGGRVALVWLAAFAANLTFTTLRGGMDGLGFPSHGAKLDEAMFGTLPSVWLQSHLFAHAPEVFGWSVLVIHASWFFVPMLAAVLVSWKRPDRLGSLLRWWIALQLITLPLFALFPTRPPWMDSSSVIRIVALHYGRINSDNNPMAAMPSLHVALPLVVSLWFFRERWRLTGIAMLAYSGLISFEVVLSGEHYIADVAGAAAVAAAIALAARLDYRAILHWTRSRAREALAAGCKVPAPAMDSRARSRHRERAQALLAFVVAAPITFVGRVTKPDARSAPGMNKEEMEWHG